HEFLHVSVECADSANDPGKLVGGCLVWVVKVVVNVLDGEDAHHVGVPLESAVLIAARLWWYGPGLTGAFLMLKALVLSLFVVAAMFALIALSATQDKTCPPSDVPLCDDR